MRQFACLGLAAWGLSLAVTATAIAIPRVYHSAADDGVQLPYPIALPGGGSHTLHLYMETGSTP